MGNGVLTRKVKIINKHGLHLRAAGRFVETASKFRADIRVRKDNKEADGKSIMDMMTLGAEKGSDLVLMASGEDAEEALRSLEQLINDKFGEE